MLRKLDRYIMLEVLGPLTLGFLAYTFLLMMRFLFASARMIIVRGVPVEDVGMLLLLTMPNILVLTVPMSLLFAILVAVGRLSADSELVAIRSSGVSLYSLYRPILAISLFLTLLTGMLMSFGVPRANHALRKLTVDIQTRSASRQVEPRVFYEGWENVVLYVFDHPPGERQWQGVFVAEGLPPMENEVTIAERGEVRLDPSGERLELHLENAVTHQADFRRPDKYRITRYRTLDRLLEDRFTSSQHEKIAVSKGLRELTLSELRANLTRPDYPEQLRNLSRVEIHKKFAIPAACLVFGLLALPLGIQSSRGGRSSGFAVSIAIILFYYIVLNSGEEAASVGKVQPWLAMWLANIILTCIGLLLLSRRNRDRGLPFLIQIDRWVVDTVLPAARRLFARRQRPEAPAAREISAVDDARPGFIVRLPRFRLRFPNSLDRYVMRTFAQIFILVLLSGVSIYIIGDFTGKSDDILANEIPGQDVIRYYKYLTFQVIYQVAPLGVLITTLITFGLLSQRNEVTAAKALGISLYRLALPAVVSALAVAGFSLFLQIRILPASNEVVAQLSDKIKGREGMQTYRRADRQWLFGEGRFIYNYLLYEPDEGALSRLQVFEFDNRHRLSKRLFASRAVYQGNDAWLFSGAWVRAFDGLETLSYEAHERPVVDYYPETPDYFESDVKVPDAMTYGELKEYVGEVEESGQRVPQLAVRLRERIAIPVFPLVLGLVALPFSFRLGRKGALYGIGIGLVLGIVFIGLFALFSTLGETEVLSPAIAVWSPSLIFVVLSLYLFLGVRS